MTTISMTHCRKFVHMVQIAQWKYHPLLAVTTTVSLVILGLTAIQPSTLMMFSGMGNNVELLRPPVVPFPTCSHGSTRYLTCPQVMSLR